ncbi:MAG: hypothetical protein MI867_10940 [Pseudomonadales bacterium]|nr:hypothetical protein [Pseudomonadales bacterium]
MAKSSALDPFDALGALIPALTDLYSAVKAKKSDRAHQLAEKIVARIYEITDHNHNAALAAIHLSKEQSPLKQPIYSAVIAHLLSIQHGIEGSTKESLMLATLLANLTFYEFQVLLNTMDGKLTDAQRAKLHKHPLEASQKLEAAGFLDPTMIKAVRQHHERLDGKGYPNRLKGNEISTLALIISICETYTARIDNRAYRKPVHPREALSHLLHEDDQRVKELLISLAKAIGIYPPGTWVKLANQEIAIVKGVSSASPVPKVTALFDPQGNAYLGPMERDAKQPNQKIIGSAAPPKHPSVDLQMLYEGA